MGFARLYTFPTPYNADQLVGVAYAQNANVMYCAHLDRPVQKLTRADHTDWAFSEVTFGPAIGAPTSVAATATTPNTTGYVSTPYSYVVTAISDDTGEESRASAAGTVDNDLTLDGNYNTITWAAVTGADRYAVYKNNNGVYGYVGGTEALSFRDGTPTILADLSDTPPKGQNPFNGEGNYPSAVTFHEQRLMLARTRNKPNAVFGSQSNSFENMDYSRPAKPDDALSFALVAKKVNAVNQLLSSTSLLALTTDSIFSITGGTDSPITPSSIIPKKQGERGATRLPAVEIDEVTFFQPNQGAAVRALNYSFNVDGYQSNNVSIFSPHFFEDDSIVSWAYQTEPYSCIWAAMASGVLLCFTWERDQDVWGWTLCETDGFVERVAVITEGGYDRLYAIIRRTINNVDRRFYERMALPATDDYTQACQLDCAVTQIFDPPQTRVYGLSHLEGATVSAFFDGYAASGLVVQTGGYVDLPVEASTVTVGLPFVAEIETLPLVRAAQGGTDHVDRQTFSDVAIRALQTKGITAAVTGATAEPIVEREAEAMGVLPDIDERDYYVNLPATWSNSATLTIRQEQPFPMRITGIFLTPEGGDD